MPKVPYDDQEYLRIVQNVIPGAVNALLDMEGNDAGLVRDAFEQAISEYEENEE